MTCGNTEQPPRASDEPGRLMRVCICQYLDHCESISARIATWIRARWEREREVTLYLLGARPMVEYTSYVLSLLQSGLLSFILLCMSGGDSTGRPGVCNADYVEFGVGVCGWLVRG
jgi:hypothetical protein